MVLVLVLLLVVVGWVVLEWVGMAVVVRAGVGEGEGVVEGSMRICFFHLCCCRRRHYHHSRGCHCQSR